MVPLAVAETHHHPQAVAYPIVLPYVAAPARAAASPGLFTTIAGGSLTAALSGVTEAAFPSFASPMAGLFGAPVGVRGEPATQKWRIS